MYKYTWQMAVSELMAILFGLCIGMLGVFAAWYVAELRDWHMMAATLTMIPFAMLPFATLVSVRGK